MKYILFFGLGWLLFHAGFSQSQIPSTVGQIYNLEISDTFEYAWSQRDIPAGPCSAGGTDVIIITSKSESSDSISYLFTDIRNSSPGYDCDYNVYMAPFPNGEFYDSIFEFIQGNGILITHKDSSIFTGYKSIYQCIPFTSFCFDSIFSDSSLYYGRKQDGLFNNSLSELNETYGEGLGLVKRNNFYEGQVGIAFTQQLIYYHKASGETWGIPLSLTAGVDDLTNDYSFKIYPNPASDYMVIDYNFTNLIKSGHINLEILNCLRQVIYNKELASYSGFQKIDVNHFSPGIYIVCIKNDEQVIAAYKFAKE